MGSLEQMLRERLYRALCPDPMELGEYQLGRLDRARAEVIQRHLAECPHCMAELSSLQEYLAAVAPDIEYRVGGKTDIWLARRIPLTGQTRGASPLAPAFAVRGKPGVDLQRFSIGEDGGELAIEIEPDPERPGRKVLLVILMGIEVPLPPGHMTAALWLSGQQVASAETDELGNLIIPNLLPGLYDLILTGQTFEIHVQEVNV